MKKTFVVMLAAIFAAACTTNSELVFKPQGSSHICSSNNIEAWAKAVAGADRQTQVAMLDKAYALADSISLSEGNAITLNTFADQVAAEFFAVTSKYQDENLYALALERERQCKSLEPLDFKRIEWKNGLLFKNSVGRFITDLPLKDAQGQEVMLRSLLDKKTVIFIYGESCRECDKLCSALSSSKVLTEYAAEGKINLVSIFAASDEFKTPTAQDKLSGWNNCIDYQCLIHYSNAFDSRLIPSIYLVSENGIVAVKGSLNVKEIENRILAPSPETITIALEEGEKVWGGRVADGDKMPYRDSFSTGMHANNGNQVQPLLITSKGRYVWSNEPFSFRIEGSNLVLFDLTSDVETAIVGKTLADAYHFSSEVYFPADGQLPPVEFFEKPQYNTWIELQYNQNQEDVLRYARGIIANGLPAGILMIDDTWMEDYGKWVFHPGRFPNPKAMCDELHRMGFKVMLWVCPFVSMDQYQIWAELCSLGAFVKKQNGSVYPVEWWNGYSAELDFSNPAARDWFDRQLQYLCTEYGVDGFKFDAGDFNLWPDDALYYTEGRKNYQLCEDFALFGAQYPYNEFRACWRNGGKPIVQRLHDKCHDWPSAQRLIPEMIAANLLGYYFSCPDMVGGGSFASFLPGCPIDQDLIVRSAQTHALMPMMQFSVAPWRILDKPHLNAVLKAEKIRKSLLPAIVELMHRAAETGEPVIKPLEYCFPGQGYSDIQDEFMLGNRILVAPMVYPGFERDVTLPEGTWVSDDGTTYEGAQTVKVDVPLDRIPYFTLKEKR